MAGPARDHAERPEGTIFRNTKGDAWTAWSVNSRFCRLQQALGREDLPAPDPEEVKEFAATLKRTRLDKGKEVVKTEKELMREARTTPFLLRRGVPSPFFPPALFDTLPL